MIRQLPRKVFCKSAIFLWFCHVLGDRQRDRTRGGGAAARVARVHRGRGRGRRVVEPVAFYGVTFLENFPERFF